jgi:formylglycine-generating enzyme required for sulfatase activity
MTGTSNVPLDPRQADLVKELTAVRNSLSDFRQALRPVNDEALNDVFREVLDSAERIVEEHAQRPGEHIADDIANLRSLFARRNIPREDPDLGKLASLTALRSARGALLADFDSILNEARSLGLVPIDPRSNLPATIEIERAGREGQLAALEQRLQKVEHLLETKIAPEGRRDAGRSLQQIGLVNFYVEAMKIELMLAMLETKARDLVDLAGLWRSIEAMGELTADFVATVQGLREKVTNALKRGTQALRPSVRRVVGGLKTMVASVRREARRNAPRGYVAGDRFRDFDAAPEMIVVPVGEFMMGSPDAEGDDDEHPQHKVTIKNAFAVGIAPVTRGEFAAFISATDHKIETGAYVWTDQGWKNDPSKSWRDPGFRQQDDHPVVCVNWHDAQAYVAWLRERSGGRAYRLLSEAEWEYCCRAGTASEYSTGESITAEQANFDENAKGTTSVFRFPPNPWGLRDMHGNVWEWCEDNWHENYKGNLPTDGSVWRGGDASLRVLRGGSWFDGPLDLRSAYRYWDRPGVRSIYVGFRVARTL